MRNIFAAVALSFGFGGICYYPCDDSLCWTETAKSADGSYSRLKIVGGKFDQEIRYRADGTKELHRYTDLSNASHHVTFDSDGELIGHDVMR